MVLGISTTGLLSPLLLCRMPGPPTSTRSIEAMRATCFVPCSAWTGEWTFLDFTFSGHAQVPASYIGMLLLPSLYASLLSLVQCKRAEKPPTPQLDAPHVLCAALVAGSIVISCRFTREA